MGSVIGATDEAKVWESKLRDNYVVITGLEAPKKVPDLIRSMETHFEHSKKELVQCDKCFGWSPPDLDECPYCGVGEDDDTPVVAEPVAMSTVQSSEVIKNPMEIDASAMDPELLVTESEKKPSRKKNGTTVVEAEAREPKKAPPAMKPSAPLVSILAGGKSLSSEKELDESIARFNAAATAGGDTIWLMGVELTKMRDSLWQQRTEAGKPKYRSFNQFVQEELEVSKSLAYRFMRIIENFSREQIQKYGSQILKVLVAAPKEEHQALLEKADNGATTRDLQEEVNKIRETKGIAVMETGATAAAAAAGRTMPSAAATAAAAKTRRKAAAAITIGFQAEQFTCKALARAKRGEDERPAKTLEDQPYCVVEGINGVRQFIAVKTRPTGEIEFKITLKRDKDE
jgi:hypothetical protein